MAATSSQSIATSPTRIAGGTPHLQLQPTITGGQERTHLFHRRVLVGVLVPSAAPVGAAHAVLNMPGPAVLAQVQVPAGQPSPSRVPPVFPLLHYLIRTYVLPPRQPARRDCLRTSRAVSMGQARTSTGRPDSTTNDTSVRTGAVLTAIVSTTRTSVRHSRRSTSQRRYPRLSPSKKRTCGFRNGFAALIGPSNRTGKSELIEVPTNSTATGGEAGSSKLTLRSENQVEWMSPASTTGFATRRSASSRNRRSRCGWYPSHWSRLTIVRGKPPVGFGNRVRLIMTCWAMTFHRAGELVSPSASHCSCALPVRVPATLARPVPSGPRSLEKPPGWSVRYCRVSSTLKRASRPKSKRR